MRAIKLCLWLLMLAIAMPASALEFRFGEYQLSEQGIAHCIGSGAAKSCEITFDQPFTTTPLVFLMPTIEEGVGRDAPSTLRLINVTKTGATFRQYIAPMRSGITLKPLGKKCTQNNKKTYCLETVPMDKVRYFAIEPGTLNFGDKGRIQAGTVEISRYLAGGKAVNNNNLQNVSSPVNYNASFNNPGVLLSLQGNGQVDIGSRSKWVTPVVTSVQQNLNRVFVALDRSELTSGNHYGGSAQKVAYIVAEGRGSYKGLQFAMGAGATLDTLVNGLKEFDQVTEPVLRQCAATTPVPSGFSNEPFIIASKNSRKGNNGGWIRLCRLEPSGNNGYQVSFINDEDLNEGKLNKVERKHLSENIGFMAFQRKVSEDTCDVFPGPAQTWTDRNNYQAWLHHQALIKGTYKENGKHYLWFKTTSNGKSAACDGQECNYPTSTQPDRWAEELDLGDFVEADRNAPDYNGDNTLEEYSTFYLGNATDGIEELRNGAGERIKLLDLNDGVTLHLHSGTYWLEEMRVSKGANIVTHGNVTIHTKLLTISDFATISPANNEPDSLQIYAHYSQNNINKANVLMSKGSSITALLYSENTVSMSGGVCNSEADCEVTSIIGAVTAAGLEMNSSASAPSTIINGKSSCFDTTPDFTLAISPEWQQNMLCESQEVLFSLEPDDGGGDTFAGDVTVSITAKSGQAASGVWSTSKLEGSNYGQRFSDGVPFTVPVGAFDNNQKRIWLKSDYLGELELTATIEGLSGSIPVGRYQFLPGGFVITPNPVQLVAGKPATLTVKAMACNSGDSVISEYTGRKTLNIKTEYGKPTSSNSRADKVMLQNTAGSDKTTWQGAQGEFTFSNGVASNIPVKYDDAGEMTLTLSDPKCTKDSCDLNAIGGQSSQSKSLPAGWQGLTGTALVQSRPYTFALCQSGTPNIEQASGDANSGNGFIAAGEIFHTLVRPVVWKQGDSVAESGAQPTINSSTMCSNRLITENFYKSQAPAALVELSHQLQTPNDQQAVAGTLFGGSAKTNIQLKTQPYALQWDEVGSIRLTADTQNSYLGMDINSGYRDVGRFYPKYLKLIRDDLQYPEKQRYFAYMDQPFTFGFSVGAFAESGHGTAGNAVKNYWLFEKNVPKPKLKAGIQFLVLDSTQTDEVVERAQRIEHASRKGIPYIWSWSGATWAASADQDKAAQITVNEPNLTFVRDYTEGHRGSQPRFSEKDGPFDSMNSRMGLKIVPASDPIDWAYLNLNDDVVLEESAKRESIQIWRSHPDIRYGRMALDDVSGRFDSELSIPLRVEYWDGVDFVINKQDSVAAFDGDLSCKQILSQSDTTVTSTSYTRGSGNVKSGDTRSGEFVVVPTEVKDKDGNSLIYREQVRFWQKVIGDSPLAIDKEPEIACEAGPSSGHDNYQPWLTFDWRGKGDESPHSTVTFGAYRGNDRVLYRGEKGINTMLD
ncbi:H-type lectin domain-containing protein [Photobacterium rosenbergii]|uniref:H-type lectin domain-containing protein n=1 Tax=Photobacterium rosenbergii TaxID=294936 RepID=UPI001C999E10|nr:H-type lectin domain-containing protein [Photobacterium rosenbergii]MBY5949072.1 H-type lectin domain-containing protein [Photobacterium rosenbergii]